MTEVILRGAIVARAYTATRVASSTIEEWSRYLAETYDAEPIDDLNAVRFPTESAALVFQLRFGGVGDMSI